MNAARMKKLAGLAAFQAERAAAALDRAWRRRRLLGADAAALEAEHWGGARGGLLTWQDLPLIRAHINRRVSGDEAVNWLESFARDFGAGGFERALNLGCGAGDLEAHALGIGLVRRFRSLDLAAGALERARARLPERVEFELMDVNRMRLDPGSFDLVFAASSLHHFTALPEVLDQVRLGLRPGGYFVFDEYVGPSLFQWRPRQLEIVNEILAALPRRLRRDRRGLGEKRRVYRRPLDERSRDSPFEAARSEEILPLVAERFEIARRRDYGGAILHPLLDGIAGNFREEGDDAALLARLCAVESALEQRGEIGSDFTSVVARKAEA